MQNLASVIAIVESLIDYANEPLKQDRNHKSSNNGHDKDEEKKPHNPERQHDLGRLLKDNEKQDDNNGQRAKKMFPTYLLVKIIIYRYVCK